MGPNELLTAREAADLLRMSPDTVRRLLRDGQLPGRKIGPRQWRIRRDDLDAHLRGFQGHVPPGENGADDR